VAEWSNVPDSKSGVPQGTVGSNPTLSARMLEKTRLLARFLFLHTQKLIQSDDACYLCGEAHAWNLSAVNTRHQRMFRLSDDC